VLFYEANPTIRRKRRFDPVRWRLFLITSFAAAVVALALWSALAIAVFGTADLFAENPRLLFASLLIPLGLAVAAAIFSYRHTARRRRTQAVISAMLTLLLFSALYGAAAWLFPKQLALSKISRPLPKR